MKCEHVSKDLLYSKLHSPTTADACSSTLDPVLLLTIYYHVVGAVFLRIAIFSLKYDVPRALKNAAHLALLMHPWLLVSYPRQILQNLFVILPMSSPNTSAAHKKGTTARVLEVVRQVVDDSCIEERVLP